MSLNPYERETVINYNESPGNASVYTFNVALQNKLLKMAKQRPDEVIVINSKNPAMEFSVPRKWIKVNPPKQMSDEAKAKAADRLAKARIAKADPSTL